MTSPYIQKFDYVPTFGQSDRYLSVNIQEQSHVPVMQSNFVANNQYSFFLCAMEYLTHHVNRLGTAVYIDGLGEEAIKLLLRWFGMKEARTISEADIYLSFLDNYIPLEIPSLQLIRSISGQRSIHQSAILFPPFSEPFSYWIALHRSEKVVEAAIDLSFLNRRINYIDTHVRGTHITSQRWVNSEGRTDKDYDSCSRDLILADYRYKIGNSRVTLDQLNSHILNTLRITLTPDNYKIPTTSISTLPIVDVGTSNLLSLRGKLQKMRNYLSSIALTAIAVGTRDVKDQLQEGRNDDNVTRVAKFITDQTTVRYNSRFYSEDVRTRDRFNDFPNPVLMSDTDNGMNGATPTFNEYTELYRTEGRSVIRFVHGNSVSTGQCDIAVVYYPELSVAEQSVEDCFKYLRLGGLLIVISYVGTDSESLFRGRLAKALLTGKVSNSPVSITDLMSMCDRMSDSNTGDHLFKVHENSSKKYESAVIYAKTVI